MYFSIIPDIEYGKPPVRFPFSQIDYITAKNFFRRYKINEDIFSYSVYFKKYVITDSDRLDLLAEKTYGSPFYDWVIVLTNNMINTTFDWPKTEYELRQLTKNPDETHHYETLEIKNSEGKLVLQGGLTVDESFVNKPFVYVDKTFPSFITTSKPGNEITVRYTNLDWEIQKNDKKREIYLLKQNFLGNFVNSFKKQNLYARSSNYIDSQLKKTG
jgi:hypothetical protein